MDEREWYDLVNRINADIAGIARAQSTLNDVHAERMNRLNSPVEEDFIDRDSFGEVPGEPNYISINGIEIAVRKLHRRGIRCSDIKGADLIYELEGRKFCLIQYKSPSRRRRVPLDREQLRELINACPNPCPPITNEGLRTCGSWYSVQEKGSSYYMRACEAREVFGDYASKSIGAFSQGISKASFQDMFAKCWIGARVAPIDVGFYLAESVANDRVVVHAQQSDYRW